MAVPNLITLKMNTVKKFSNYVKKLQLGSLKSSDNLDAVTQNIKMIQLLEHSCNPVDSVESQKIIEYLITNK